MIEQVKYMGIVVCLESYKATRTGASRFETVACPLCDSPAEGRGRGQNVAYVCDGGEMGHARLEWTHMPDQVVARPHRA